MKIIPKPDLSGDVILKPAEMNKIHFGGNHTPLTPEQLKAMAAEYANKNSSSGSGEKREEK